MDSKQLSDWISISEAARLRGVSAQAISELVKKDRFETLTVAGRTLLNKKEVKAYKAKGKGGRPFKNKKAT